MQIVATGFGNPDVLEAVPSEERTPGKGEVTIAVRAAAVNPRDLKVYASRDYTRSLGSGTPKFPLQLGVEAAGIVIEAGPEAMGVAGPVVVGDEVIAYRIDGAYADVITVSADRAVPKPAQLSWEQAGSIMLTGTTATHALAAVRARSGQTVLIHAAAGSVAFPRCNRQHWTESTSSARQAKRTSIFLESTAQLQLSMVRAFWIVCATRHHKE